MVEVEVYLPPKGSRTVIVDPLEPRNRVEIYWGQYYQNGVVKQGRVATVTVPDGEGSKSYTIPLTGSTVSVNSAWSVKKAPAFVVTNGKAELKAWVGVSGGGDAKVSGSTEIPQVLATDGKRSSVVYRNEPGLAGLGGIDYLVIGDFEELNGYPVQGQPVGFLAEEKYLSGLGTYALVFKEAVSHRLLPQGVWVRRDPLHGGLTIGDLFMGVVNGFLNPGPGTTYKGTVRLLIGDKLMSFTSPRGEQEIKLGNVWPPEVSINADTVLVGSNWVVTVELPGNVPYNVRVFTDFIPCGAVSYSKSVVAKGPTKLTFKIPTCKPVEGHIYVAVSTGNSSMTKVFSVRAERSVAVGFSPSGNTVPQMSKVVLSVQMANRSTYDVLISWDVDGRQRRTYHKTLTGPAALKVPIKVLPGHHLNIYYFVKQNGEVVAQGVRTYKIQTYPHWCGPINYDAKMLPAKDGIEVQVKACNTAPVKQALNLAVAFNGKVTRRYDTAVNAYGCWSGNFTAKPPGCGSFEVELYVNGCKLKLGTIAVPCPKQTKTQPSKPAVKPSPAPSKPTSGATKPTAQEEDGGKALLFGLGVWMLLKLMAHGR